MTLTKYERVVGVMVQPAEIRTVDGLMDLHTVTVMLPSMTTLYDAAGVDDEIPDPYAGGFEAAHCPYAPDTPERELWLKGFMQDELAMDVLEPEYTACRARAAAAEQHLKANDAALGLTGVESRPQAMYIRDLQNQLAHAEFDHDHYELVKQQLEAVKQEKQRNYDHYSDQLAHFEQQLAQVIAERDAAETRNENYRLKLHTRDQQLAEVQERYESLKERS